MSQASPTRPVLTVDLLAIAENFRMIRSAVAPAEVAAAVKADAYGLGARPVARALAAAGCKAFFVAHMEEALDLRQDLPQATIFVLHGFVASQAVPFATHKLSPVISSLPQLEAWLGAGIPIPYALHVDTGMSRLGLSLAEAQTASNFARPTLLVSHLACADDATDPHNLAQLTAFKTVARRFPHAWTSLDASSGCFLGPEYTCDLVRPGIALYGGNPRKSGENPMRGVATLTAPILQVRSIDRGDTVGYGATYEASGPRRLAVAALGYADGLMRTLSNRGHGFVGGIRCPIVGRVSMDLVTLDISECPPAAATPGTHVEFIGPSQPVDELARSAGTLAYEVFTRLGPRIIRQYTGTQA
ncbi:MAG: alanine racemase [Alphaproteobacteria bacterium]|nr:alanine racemase [Alphaproteobacteria bacterium]